MFCSTNPTTGEIIKEYSETSFEEAKEALQASELAYQKWRKLSFLERGRFFKQVASILRDRKMPLAKLMADEMGKPIQQGQSEIEKCALCCEYFAEQAESFLQPENIQTEIGKTFITFQPLGVIFGIMPWNFPFWQVFRFVVPTLMAGNTALIKHASNVSGCSLAIRDVFQQAGFPSYVLAVLLLNSEKALELIAHPLVKAVSLTGSVEAGRSVASKCGESLKKVVLELGGSDPYLVLHDANLDQAVSHCVTSRLTNTGQSCIAAKRFIVVKEKQSDFQEKVVERMREVKMGDPNDPTNDIGPLARLDLRESLHGQVVESKEQGADCLLGGAIPSGSGAFYPPTVLTNVKKGMPAYHQELFGPVAVIIPAEDEGDAVHIANDTDFGLGAAIFTEDRKRGEKLATFDCEAGSCFVNTLVKSDVRLPFGGIKASGYGRELSRLGIREFVNIKTVRVV